MSDFRTLLLQEGIRKAQLQNEDHIKTYEREKITAEAQILQLRDEARLETSTWIVQPFTVNKELWLCDTVSLYLNTAARFGNSSQNSPFSRLFVSGL